MASIQRTSRIPGYRPKMEALYAKRYGRGQTESHRACVSESFETGLSYANFLYLLEMEDPAATKLLAGLKTDCAS